MIIKNTTGHYFQPDNYGCCWHHKQPVSSAFIKEHILFFFLHGTVHDKAEEYHSSPGMASRGEGMEAAWLYLG